MALLSPDGSSQDLDGLWFKVTTKIQGRGINVAGNVAGEVSSLKGKLVGYLYVAEVGGHRDLEFADFDMGNDLDLYISSRGTTVEEDDAEEAGDGGPIYPYTGSLYMETGSGSWDQVSSTEFLTIGTDEAVMTGPSLGFEDDGISLVIPLDNDDEDLGDKGAPINYVRLVFTARTKIKFKGEGVVSKASFTSFGAIVPAGFGDDQVIFAGGKISGKSVAESKLPFTPEKRL
jgi:hypothetical protein